VLDGELGLRSACDRCHDDAARTRVAAASWWPSERPERARARALHAVRAGDAQAGALVHAALAAETQPTWRAILLALSDDADARLAAAADPDPWLRRAALAGLPVDDRTRPALLAALKDPVAAVRLEAASALAPVLPPTDARMAELLSHLRAHADQPGEAFTLGGWWARHGLVDEALPWLRRAAALDPASAETWRTLAVTEAAAGRDADALATLDRAVARLPDAPELRFARALALVPLGRADEVIAELRRVLELDPRHGRAAYDLGLALHQRGDPSAATWLAKAEALLPDDPAPPYALATLAVAANDRARAKAAADRALARDPTHAGARQVLAWAASGR
jgi:tetratricopeptide (TPR) repeat protein